MPEFVQRSIIQVRKKRKIREQQAIFRANRLSSAEVNEAFSRIDLHGDLFVHASLVNIGCVKGVTKPFVDCLNTYVVEKGHTLLFPAIPVKGSTLQFLKENRNFSKDSPNEMGLLSRSYGSLPGSHRSMEPTHSVIAYGQDAGYYTETHHLDSTPFGKNSPYFKHFVKHGQILMIGAPLINLTVCHMIEDLLGDCFPYKVYSGKSFEVCVTLENGSEYHGRYSAHSPFVGSLRSPEYILDKLLKLPTTQIVSLGASRLIALESRDVIRCCLKELAEGHSIYGHVCVSSKTRRRIQSVIAEYCND